MSAADNVATIHEIYDAFGRGDVELILSKLADDVDWGPDAASDAAAWYGIRHGREEVVGFFEGIASTTDVKEFDVKTIASTDNEVLSFIRYGFSPKGSDEVTSMNLHHYFRFDGAGKIAYYRGSE